MKHARPILLLTALVVLAYANTLETSFHYDDIPSILEKPWIRGLDKIPQFITSFSERPVVILSFNLNYAISGFEVWSYHAFNLLFHWAVVLLVYRLARCAGPRDGEEPGDPAARVPALPFLAAALFALHPLNTQAVTYISSRSSLLATGFYLGALLFSVAALDADRGRRWKRAAFWAGAAGCFSLGLLTKLIVITLPVMLFLFHYYFRSREPFFRWAGTRLRWLLGIGLPLLAGGVYQQYFAGGLLRTQPTDYTGLAYFLTQVFVIPFEYFRKMLFPFNLSIDPHLRILELWPRLCIAAGSVVLAVYLAAWWAVSRRKAGGRDRPARGLSRDRVGFALAWILITLLPTSSFVPLLDPVAEHRTYLPMAGFALLAAAGLDSALRRWRLLRPVGVPLGGAWVPLAVLGCFAATVLVRNGVWKNEITLWSDAKAKAPALVRPYNNVGEAYDRRGLYDQAIAEFEAALQLQPDYFYALNNLGNIYGKKKQYGKAIRYFQKALEQKPDYPPAYYNLAKALHLTGRPAKAMDAYRTALRFNPHFEQARFNLANLALQLGRVDEAIEHFQKFLEMQPRNPRARFALGNAYAAKGRQEDARRQYRLAIEAEPGFVFPYINLANLQLQEGRVDAALATYEEVLALQPDVAGVHKNLGMIYYQFRRDPEKALHHFERSLRLAPGQPQADLMRSLVGELKNRT